MDTLASRRPRVSAWWLLAGWTVVAVAANAAGWAYSSFVATDLVGLPIESVAVRGAGCLSGLVALAALPVALVMALFRRTRRAAAPVAAGAAIWLACDVAAQALLVDRRTPALEELTRRGAPIVDAIRRHEAERGRPPEYLDELVPGFLPALPPTGLERVAWHYDAGDIARDHADNPWMLWLDLPQEGFIAESDSLLYLPRQNYPQQGWMGPTLRRVGDWALDVD